MSPLGAPRSVRGFTELGAKHVKADRAYLAIRRRILRGEFQPGDWLIAHHLMESTGIGRTPTRDALLRLQGDGLVRMSGQYGAHVTALTTAELRELGELRLALAGYAARLAAKRSSNGDLARIASAYGALRGRRRGPTTENAMPPDGLAGPQARFIFAVVVAAQNPLVADRFLRAQWLSSLQVVAARPADGSVCDLIAAQPLCQAVMDALIQRNDSAAQAAMEDCLRSVIAHELRHKETVEESESDFEPRGTPSPEESSPVGSMLLGEWAGV